MNKKLIVLSMFLICLASATALSSLGTFKQGDEIILLQTCSDCNFNNISVVYSPNGTELIKEVAMTKDNKKYNYTLNSTYTATRGIYSVAGYGDPGSVETIWIYTFEVTGTGYENENTLDLVFVISLFGVLFFVAGLVLFFRRRNDHDSEE